VYEEGDVTVLWNQAVHTETGAAANRPDMIIKNKNKEKTCTLADVAIPADKNVVQKEAEKKLKYESLCIEIQRMWNLKCTIIPVIIKATGIVTRNLRGKNNSKNIYYYYYYYYYYYFDWFVFYICFISPKSRCVVRVRHVRTSIASKVYIAV
jgi:hypothetical protein